MRFFVILMATFLLTPSFAQSATLSKDNEAKWAYAKSGKIYSQPQIASKTKTKLTVNNVHGKLVVYRLVQSKEDTLGRNWIQIRYALPYQKMKSGWVLKHQLGEFHSSTTKIVVNRSAFTMTVYKNGRKVANNKIGVGAKGTETPKGFYWINEKFAGKNAVYGPVTFTTTARASKNFPGFGNVVGIHGVNGLGASQGFVSHGCMRVAWIKQLASLVNVGDPIIIK